MLEQSRCRRGIKAHKKWEKKDAGSGPSFHHPRVRGGGPGRINYRVFKGASSTRLVATLGNDLETRPNALKTRGEIGLEVVADPGCKGAGKPFTVSEACVPTPPDPPFA